MRKTIRLVLASIILPVLGSCIPKDELSPITVPTSSPSQPISSSPTVTPISSSIRISHESIFLGTDSGEYVIYDMLKQEAYGVTFPGKCRIARLNQTAVCRTERGLEAIDLVTGDWTVLPIENPSWWSLTTGDRSIYYASEEGEDLWSLHRFDWGQVVGEFLATISPDGWSIFPKISDHGRVIVGTRYGDTLNRLYEITLDGNYQRFGPDITAGITDLSWSPAGELLGLGATDISYDEPGFCNTTVFLVYVVSTGQIKQVARAPEGTCYAYFQTETSNIWSPDGTMVALIPSNRYVVANQEFCILNVEPGTQHCIPGVHDNEWISRVAWSPDSRYLAYIVENRDMANDQALWIISIDGSSRWSLLEDLSLSGDITDLVWIDPKP